MFIKNGNVDKNGSVAMFKMFIKNGNVDKKF